MRTAPYGTWRSPITPRLITAEQVGLASPWLDGGSAWWTESRPLEGGRVTLMRRRAGSAAVEVTPAPFNLRTRVHEYGGRGFVASGDLVLGSAFADQRLWRLDGAPRALTPVSDAALRYAEPVLDAARGRVLAVREDHRGQGEPRNELVAVPLEGEPDEGAVLDGRHDFVAYPRPSPDGRRLAWVSWDHPDMPWDGTSLWVADLDARGLPAEPVRVAGGRQESVLQPEWAADGTLYFLSDRGGWWNLHRWRGGDVAAGLPDGGRARRTALAAGGQMVRARGRAHGRGDRHAERARGAGRGSTWRPARRPGWSCRSSTMPGRAVGATGCWCRRWRRRPRRS